MVALGASLGSCHFTAMRSDPPEPPISTARVITTRPSIEHAPTIRSERRARPSTVARTPTTSPKRTLVRTPTLDCTPREEVGYRRGKRRSITTIRIDGDLVETSTADAYLAMRAAAAEEGIPLTIYSAFRTAAEQEWFYGCYECGCCNRGVLAAKPGWSNHQSGLALDLGTSTPGVLPWLKANAARFGFSNTVRSEPWHWEYGGKPRFDPVCDPEAA